MRLALETGDAVGTSGSYPWNLIRFALEKDGVSVCVTTKADLVYNDTHHNCSDTASVMANGIRYDIIAPDRVTTVVSAFMGATRLWGPVVLMNTTCVSNNSCRSGAPC